MANKINGIDTSTAPIGAGGGVQPVRDATTRTQSSAPQESEVHITDTAAQLASLEQTLKSTPVVDDARVDAFSSAIADGSYAVDSQKVAFGLMRSDQGIAQMQDEA